MIPRYRAWLKNDKEMIDVDEIHFDNGKLDFIGDAITFMRTVDEIELMQSTGIFDKNNKEIFEGDIVTNGIDIVDIKYHQTLGFYTLVNGREVFFGHGTSIEEFEEDIEGFSEIAEIIGNVWEDGDLIDGKKTSEN